MKFMKSRTLLTFLMAGVCGGALLYVSQSVQQAEHQLFKIRAETKDERERFHVLKAEWQFLNAPQRLDKLAREHTDLRPPEDLPSVFLPPEHLPAPPSAAPAGELSQTTSPYMQPVFFSPSETASSEGGE